MPQLLQATINSIATKVNRAGDTLTGELINSTANPTQDLSLVPRIYTNSIKGVVSYKVACCTTANLNATYNNGTSGVGATLTSNSAAKFTSDGYLNPNAGDLVLVINQSNQAQNGLYSVTTVGSGTVSYQLTRLNTFDEASEMLFGTSFYVVNGTLYGNHVFYFTTASAITVGTTSLTFTDSANTAALAAISAAINSSIQAHNTYLDQIASIPFQTGSIIPLVQANNGSIAAQYLPISSIIDLNNQLTQLNTNIGNCMPIAGGTFTNLPTYNGTVTGGNQLVTGNWVLANTGGGSSQFYEYLNAQVNSGTYSLPNPIPTFIDVYFNSAGLSLQLPAFNSSTLPTGKTFFINASAQRTGGTLLYADGTTAATILTGNLLICTWTDNGQPNGQLTYASVCNQNGIANFYQMTINNPAVPSYVPTAFNYYEDYIQVNNLTVGGALSATIDYVLFRRIGNTLVEMAMHRNASSPIGNNNTITISGIPARYCPLSTVCTKIKIGVSASSSPTYYSDCIAEINSSGTITIFNGNSTDPLNTFPAANYVAFGGGVVQWNIS